jgi:hypothetical protein
MKSTEMSWRQVMTGIERLGALRNGNEVGPRFAVETKKRQRTIGRVPRGRQDNGGVNLL